jgi:hypothetical protein
VNWDFEEKGLVGLEVLQGFKLGLMLSRHADAWLTGAVPPVDKLKFAWKLDHALDWCSDVRVEEMGVVFLFSSITYLHSGNYTLWIRLTDELYFVDVGAVSNGGNPVPGV